MTIPFRQMILNMPDHLEIKREDNVLYHSKLLFTQLLKSELPSFNPYEFFLSNKDYDGSAPQPGI